MLEEIRQEAKNKLMQAKMEQTLCTDRTGDNLELRRDRPALVVSSTSWTPDEDFGLLLEAAQEYDQQVPPEDALLSF